MAFQGRVTYPGIQQWENFSFTDISGISPAMATMDVYPQDEVPQADGNIVITYEDNEGGSGESPDPIVLLDCHIDQARYVRDSGGKIVQVSFFDERWSWQFYRISGRYNFKQVKAYDSAFNVGAAVEFVDPAHEKTPQELVKLCIEALGYSEDDWDISDLPNDSRPEVNWVAALPAQEIANIADALGCRIVPIRSEGIWKIVVTGDGEDLPDDIAYVDPSDGVDPIERPDWLEIQTAETLYECRLALTPVGLDIDERYKPFPDLSYAPEAQSGTNSEFAWTDPAFYNISRVRVLQSDLQTLISPCELAQQSIFRTYGIRPFDKDGEASVSGEFIDRVGEEATEIVDYGQDPIPGASEDEQPEALSHIILTDRLVKPYIKPGSTQASSRPAFVEGEYWHDKKPTFGNYPIGTKIVQPAGEYLSSEVDNVTGFSMQISEDTNFSFLHFSRPLKKYSMLTPPGGGSSIINIMMPGELYLHTAIKIRDKKTWQPLRKSFVKWIGEGDEPSDGPDETSFVKTYIKDDIQPWYRGEYEYDGTLTSTVDNIDQCEERANYYLDAIEKTFETVETSTRTYIGLFNIDMDGKISQVQYTISKQGSDTIASSNTEHNFDIPPYEARRAREARADDNNRKELQKTIQKELRLKGLGVL